MKSKRSLFAILLFLALLLTGGGAAATAEGDPAVADGYYLVGTVNGWRPDAAYRLNETETDGVYDLDGVALSPSDLFSVVRFEGGDAVRGYPQTAIPLGAYGEIDTDGWTFVDPDAA